MRRRLYDLFGLPQLPDSEPVEVAPESLPVQDVVDPIHIPKPVRKVERKPVKDLRFHDLGSKRWIDWASEHQGLPRRGLRYIRPDDMHRLPLDAMSARLQQGDIESTLKPTSWVGIQSSINLDNYAHQMTMPNHQVRSSIDPIHIG